MASFLHTVSYSGIKSFSFSNQILVLMQNNYKGWKVSVNDKEQEIYTADKSLIAIYLPKGENNIVFTFEKPLIVFGFYITLLSLIGLLIFYVYLVRKEKKSISSLHYLSETQLS